MNGDRKGKRAKWLRRSSPQRIFNILTCRAKGINAANASILIDAGVEKIFDIAKNELRPVEYARTQAIVTPKINDAWKDLRKS